MLARTTRRRRRLSLTPLVDVIFLLLLFFMLSSTFLRYGSVEIAARAAAPGSAAATTGQTALLKLRGDGTLALNGETVADDALAATVAELSAGGTGRLLLSAETGADVQRLVAVMERLDGAAVPVVLVGGRSGPVVP